MNVMVYASLEEYNSFVSMLSEVPELQYRTVKTAHVDNYDGLIKDLGENKYDIVFITVDGAEGMEGVMASRSLEPETPVVWISDDKGFGAQSHRLGCTFFSPKPLDGKILSTAIKIYLRQRI